MWGAGSRQDGQAQKLLLLHEAGHIQTDGTKSAITTTATKKPVVSRISGQHRLPHHRYEISPLRQALFSFKIFWKIDTIALPFVFDKYCPIMD